MGREPPFVHGQRPLFAYGQGTAESRISGEGGEQNIRGGWRKACRSATGVPEAERGGTGL